MNPLRKALDLIKRFEGIPDGDPTTVNLDPYLDPVGIWTIGWGHVVRDEKGRPIRGKENRDLAYSIYPNGLTKREAAVLLRDDVRVVVAGMRRLVTEKLEPFQWAALISFTFNLGLGNLRKSTLLKYVNARAFDRAALEFAKWNKAKGKVLNGLVVRRKAEEDCFRGV